MMELRQRFAAGAEVGIVADRTLVPNPRNVRSILLSFAERTIAVNADVSLGALRHLRNRFVERYKAMSWMAVTSILEASRAVVPVRAVHALVTYTMDVLDVLEDIVPSRRLDIPYHIHRKLRNDECFGQACKDYWP